MASCSSKIKFCRAAILSSFHDGGAATWASPQQQQSWCTPGWSPCTVQNKRGTSSCPQGSPWRMHSSPFPRDKHWGRNGSPLCCHRHALMQCQVQAQSLICVTERALSKCLQRALCRRLVPAMQRSGILFCIILLTVWPVKLVQFSQ